MVYNLLVYFVVCVCVCDILVLTLCYFCSRPVMAILDIEVLEVDPDKRDVILDDLIQEHGPSDCTVIVTMATGEEFSDEMIDAVLDTFAEADLSETILVRLVQVVDEL